MDRTALRISNGAAVVRSSGRSARTWLAGATAMLGACVLSAPVWAQAWPARSIRVIVPFPPGQTADLVTRLITEPLGVALGRQMIVDNRPGAGTLIGTEMGAKAAPDGYTILAGGSSALGINPHLYSKIGYDTLRDFAPITIIHNTIFVFCVNQALPVKSIPELVALAKRRPDEVTYGSSGPGTPQHLAMALFGSRAGIKLTHVPYKGAVASLTDLIAGQISIVAEGTPTVMPYVKAGKIRPLAVSSAERSPFMPELPSLQQLGFAGYEVLGWTSFVAPTGTPEAIVERLSSESIRIINSPEVKKRLFEWGLGALGYTRERSSAFLKSELAKWGEAVRISGARIE
jgi:tripartite-type tricarboxylate transporter receptor subunit TctC